MASTLSNLATRLSAQAAAIATAAGGTIVTADIQALAAVVAAMSLRPGVSQELLSIAATPATVSTMLVPG